MAMASPLSVLTVASGAVAAASAATLLHTWQAVVRGQGVSYLWNGVNGVRVSCSAPTNRPPLYANMAGSHGLGVGVPLSDGGRVSQERHLLTQLEAPSVHRSETGPGLLFMDAPTRECYVYSAERVASELSAAGVDASTLPIVLPLKVTQWRYTPGTLVRYHADSGVLSTRGDVLAEEVVWSSGAAGVLFSSSCVFAACGVAVAWRALT